MVDKTQNSVLGIPAVPKDASPSVQSYLRALAEAVEKSIGVRGDPENRNPTVKELADAGILERTDFSAKFNPNDVNEQNRGYKSVKAGGGSGRVKMFTSERQITGINFRHVFKHNLGKIPDLVQVSAFVTKTNNSHEFTPKEAVVLSPYTDYISIATNQTIGFTMVKNEKEIRINIADFALASIVPDDTGGGAGIIGIIDEVELEVKAFII